MNINIFTSLILYIILLGKIPLRQLVYRVLDLAPSMKPLVYDFGQLNNATEKDYTRQIVKDRCRAISEVTSQTKVIQSVANVLAWSQQYMRARNVGFFI